MPRRFIEVRNHYCCADGCDRWGVWGYAGHLLGRDAGKRFWFCDEHRERAEARTK